MFDKGGKVAQSNICNSIKDKVAAFKPKVPAIVALRNPGMKPRHWEQLSEKVRESTRNAGKIRLFILILNAVYISGQNSTTLYGNVRNFPVLILILNDH